MHSSNRVRRPAALLGLVLAALAVAAIASAAGTRSAGVPGPPTGVRQTGATQTSITVSWDKAVGDVAGYDTYLAGKWLGYQHPTSKTVTGLACGTSHAFEAVAYNEGRTLFSARVPVTATTSPCDTAAPVPVPVAVPGPAPVTGSTPTTGSQTLTAPGNLRLSASSGTSLTVAWDATSGLAAGYDTWVGGSWLGYQTERSKTVTGLACGTSHTVAVKAYNEGRTVWSPAATLTASTSACTGTQPNPVPSAAADTVAPSAPDGLAVTQKTTKAVSLSWRPSSDNVLTTQYRLYRNGTLAGTSGSTAYSFTGLACGTSYTFAVAASDAAGNVSGRTSVGATTSGCPKAKDALPPTAPSVTIAGRTATTISVAWTASTDNVAVAGYGLYRNGVRVATSGASTRSYSFAGLACDVSYTLAVDAHDAAGNRSTRGSRVSTTLACSTPTPTPTPTPVPAPIPAPGGAASVFVAPTGSDANACTQAAPCSSFNRAYRAAQPGQVVAVAGGAYPDQHVQADASKTSAADVVFQPAAGASVVIGSKPLSVSTPSTRGLTAVGAKHVTFRGFTIRGDVQASGGAEDVTFENLVSANGLFAVYAPTRDVTFRGGSFGGTNRYQAQVYPGANGVHNVNFTLDGTVLHDVRSDNLSTYHVECLLLSDAIGAVIRNTQMYNCDVFDLSIGVFNGGVLSNVVVENNFFGTRGNQSGLGLNTNTTSWNGLNIRNNTSLTAMRHPVCTGGCTNVVYSGNISPLYGSWACVGGVSYRYNVWMSGAAKCGASDLGTASVAFANPSGTPPDPHLATGSIAIGRGDPTNAPATDIDGEARGSVPDAGADEA